MSDDLTRDEIRAACEVVGWKWIPGSRRIVDGSLFRFHPRFRWRWDGDAIALLRAWAALGDDREVQMFVRPDWMGVILVPGSGFDDAVAPDDDPDLPAVAVRAVNQWKETKKETP